MYGDLEEDELGAPRTVGDAIRRSRARDEEPDERTRVLLEELARSPEERHTLFAETPVGPTVHSHPDGTSTRTPGDSDAETRALEALAGRRAAPEEAEYPVERPEDSVLRSDQMQGADDPEGWERDSEGALASLAGRSFDYDRTPTSTQGMDDASRTTRDRGTSLEGRGARVPGTLDMARPAVQMPDGSTATVRSASFGTDDGEVLLPTISPEGREWSNEEALDAYRRGGGHLGIYDSPDAATRAAMSIHEDEARGVGYPADDNEAVEASRGIVDDEAAEEGPNAEIYGATTDADPELPSRVSPGAASIPGYPADDNEATEAARGIDDDESAEAFGGLELADPRGPRAPKSLDELLASDEERPDFAAGTNRAAQIAALQMIVDGMAQVGSAMSGGRGYSPFTSGASDELMAAGAATDAGTAREASERRSDELARSRMESQERIASIRAAADEPSDFDRMREANRAAEAARSAEIRSRGLDLAERGLTERGERTAEETAAAERRRDPASEDSDRARQLLAREIETLSPAIRESLSAVDLSGLNAEEADAYRDDLPMLIRDRLGRGRGGAGGGGGSATRSTLGAELVRTGVAEDEAAADRLITSLGIDGARRELAAAVAPATAAGSDGPELVPGVRAGLDMSAPEVTAWRSGWRAVRGRMDALRSIEEIATREGLGAAVRPQVIAELEPYMMALRGLAADTQGTGVINPSEMPAINAALPDATSLGGMTFGRFVGALRGWRGSVESAVRHSLEDYGVDPDSTSRALSALRAGTRVERGRRASGGSSSTSSGAPAADVVRVRGPDGTIRRIPRDRIPRGGVPEGFEVVE